MSYLATILFAEISDAVWLAVIGVVAMAIKECFDIQRARRVKDNLEVATVIQAKKIDKVADKLEEVHAVTNGMKDALIHKEGIIEHAKGVQEGKEMARRRKDDP